MKRKWLLCLTIIALSTGLLPWAGRASANRDTASGLAQGDDFLLSRAVGCQSYVALTFNDDADEYLVVWSDPRGGSLDWDIYGQFVSSAGVPRGDNFLIRDEAAHGLWYPDVAYDTVNQRYLVVWEDYTENDIEGIVLNSDGTAHSAAFNVADGTVVDIRSHPAVACYAHAAQGVYAVAYERGTVSDYNLYARLVSVDGGTAGGELAVCTASGSQTDPDVAVDPATGHFLVAWEDGRATNDRIYGRLLDATGSLGTEFTVANPSDPVYNPAVAFGPDAGTAGEWLVVYQRDEGGDDQIRGRRVTAAGAATGTGIHICDDSEDQWSPDIAYHASSGEYLVVWRDDRAGATNYDIYGRRVDAAGSTAGDVFAVSTASGDERSPAVAASTSATDPGYLVAFGSAEDIKGQRVDPDGALVGPRFTISAALDDQTQPAGAYNSQDQEYLVVWQDMRAGTYDIYGQRVDLDGTLLDENLVISAATNGQKLPDVAYNPATNQYLVVWEDYRNGSWDIYGQRVNADGTLDGDNLAIAGGGSAATRRPRVASNPIADPSEYLVVFTYEADNGNIRGRRVPASGDPTGASFNIATGAAAQDYAAVACHASSGGGNYLVVWRETSGTQRDVRGQRVGRTGTLQGGVLDICVEAHSQWSPRVAYSPDADHYLVAWPDDRNSATQGRDIYGRRVGGAGVLKDELAICTAAEDQKHVAVAYSGGLGDWVVAWDDARNAATTPDLYAQRVNNDGTTAGTNDLLFEYSGWQQYPALAWSDTEEQGLVAWQDGRNGDNFDIYGLLLGAGEHTLYLPLVVREWSGSQSQSPQVAGCGVFPANNVWNARVDTLPVDANSAAYVNTIGASAYVHADFGSGTWEGGPIGIPYVAVPGAQALVAVTFDYADESDPGPYPIPPDAPIEGGAASTGDRHVLVVDQDNCILYELFDAWPQGDGSWHAGSGAVFDLNSHALRTADWTSADAAGLPILPGLVRYDEVAAGEIRHALRFTAPQTRRAYIWPARHYASSLTEAQYPPMGQRFRLRADFDLSGFSSEVQVILQALKTYGMFLADNGSAWFISGVPDERWDNDHLHELHQVHGSDFEAVDESSLMVDPNSGQAQ